MTALAKTSRLLVAVLTVVALAMAAAGVVFLVRAHSLGHTSATANQALVDTSGTKQVQDQVSSALDQILTFDHTKPDATKDAADKVLTGAAKRQYGELFAALLKQSGSQELTLTSKVAKVGVMSLDGSSADLLVFLDQSSTSAADGKSSLAAAQLAVTAVKRDGTWLISGLDPL